MLFLRNIIALYPRFFLGVHCMDEVFRYKTRSANALAKKAVDKASP